MPPSCRSSSACRSERPTRRSSPAAAGSTSLHLRPLQQRQHLPQELQLTVRPDPHSHPAGQFDLQGPAAFCRRRKYPHGQKRRSTRLPPRITPRQSPPPDVERRRRHPVLVAPRSHAPPAPRLLSDHPPPKPLPLPAPGGAPWLAHCCTSRQSRIALDPATLSQAARCPWSNAHEILVALEAPARVGYLARADE